MTPLTSVRVRAALPAYPTLSPPVRQCVRVRWRSHGITPIGWQSGCQGADQPKGMAREMAHGSQRNWQGRCDSPPVYQSVRRRR